MKPENLLKISEAFFLKVQGIPPDEPLEMPPLAQELKTALDDFSEAAQRAGFAPGLVGECEYALCAWADEWIYTRTAAESAWFAYSLTAQRFDDFAAGANFFVHLDAIHSNPQLTPALEVYGRALLRGFLGKYRMENASCSAPLKAILSKCPQLATPAPTSFHLPAAQKPPSPWPKRALALSVLCLLASLAVLAVREAQVSAPSFF
jgi:type IV/VI secretion system ImpK/VasF family protein